MSVIGRRIRVTGTVQGVGFRPFVYRHAVALGVTGTVLNDSAGVLIDATGPPGAVDELVRRLREDPPPLAVVTGVTVTEADPAPAAGFGIVESDDAGEVDVPVSVDTATCTACRAEIEDPADRRYRYPFTNCTDCGPRYTIVTSVPYDRFATTMAGFTMCPRCQAEYDDPADRRFHAQPNACPDCGPRLSYLDPAGAEQARGPAALDAAVAALAGGGIVAIKGLGGYHLAVDAADPAAVAELRRRKHRDDKPFAVMVPDRAGAHQLCHLDADAVTALTSPRRPIVLAPRRPDAPVAGDVAPGLPDLGLMLPYTPLHHLLLGDLARPLILTSGNLSDEPIAHADGDAVTRLGPLVDGLLTHDRPIHIRCDDSVVRSLPNFEHFPTATVAKCSKNGGIQVLRRSRGYAPEPMALPVPAPRPLLAVGAELKSTIAVARGATVVASHHIGDLGHLPAYRSFLQAVDHLCHLSGVRPEVVAHDLHPDYRSTQFALDLDLPAIGVQHHHAHVASCLAEHGRTGPVLGIAYDGMGYGCDGTAWGGELLVADLTTAQRVGHLRAVPLPGGDAAARQPWRVALAWLHAAAGAEEAQRWGEAVDPRAAALLKVIDSARPGPPPAAGAGSSTTGAAPGPETAWPAPPPVAPVPITTSAGRLFDAVAALLDLRTASITYEAQAAIELEALAGTAGGHQPLRYQARLDQAGDGPLVLDPAPVVAQVLADRRRGVDRAVIAAAFHDALGRATAAAAARLCADHRLDTVALSGGAFQNRQLTGVVVDALHDAGLTTLVHREVPPNDGGISVGQAAVAATVATRSHV